MLDCQIVGEPVLRSPGLAGEHRMTTSPTLCSDRRRGRGCSRHRLSDVVPYASTCRTVTDQRTERTQSRDLPCDRRWLRRYRRTDRLAHVVAAPRAEFVAGDDP